jgi:hypothetical protein
MSRIGVAFRAFFAALGNAEKARQLEAALAGGALPEIDIAAKTQLRTPSRVEPDKPARSEAITLLSALQREARLVDLVQQPLGQFSDEQIGAAARSVLTDCAAVISRFFDLQPIAAYKLAGSVSGAGPFRGQLVHRGWRATAIKLPGWTGSKDAALVIAPAEVEV